MHADTVILGCYKTKIRVQMAIENRLGMLEPAFEKWRIKKAKNDLALMKLKMIVSCM